MATCKCFQCSASYESTNEDDMLGDGRCPACKERAKRAALKVDVEISNRRRVEKETSKLRQFLSEEQIEKGLTLDIMGRVVSGQSATPINFKQLGITPSD